MAQQEPARSVPRIDGTQAFSYVVSGVAVYGFLGWLADRWLGTEFLVALGIVLGAGLGVWMLYKRLTPEAGPSKIAVNETVTTQEKQ